MAKVAPLNIDTLPYYSDRVRSIPQDRAPLWGKMNVAENFAHNSRYFELVLEKRTARDQSNWLYRMFVKPLMLGPMTFPKNFATLPDLKAKKADSAETERERLLDLIEEFCEKTDVSPDYMVHNPLLGPLKLSQWSILAGKHLDHHLRQFGQ